MRPIFMLYLSGALAFSLTAHAASDEPEDGGVPPISTGTAKGLTLEQIKADNACNTFGRLGISVPSTSTSTTPTSTAPTGKK
ncbi:hypothetical protein [Geopseudomonas aromaticivorans]